MKDEYDKEITKEDVIYWYYERNMSFDDLLWHYGCKWYPRCTEFRKLLKEWNINSKGKNLYRLTGMY